MLQGYSSKILRRAASLPAYAALCGINMPLISRHLAQRREAALRDHPPVDGLLPIESAAAAALEGDGVFVTHLDALGLADGQGEAMMECGRAMAAALAERAGATGDRRRTMIASEPADLLRFPLLFRWGLNAVLLRIVEAYLDLPVAYDGPVLFHTPADGREAGTRKWHIDREDERVVKIGLYLHDVDAASGPFQLLRHRTDSAKLLGYRGLETAALQRKLGVPVTPQNTITCTGRAGTVIFANTGQFHHRGKPATGSARSAVFYSYFPRPPRHPFFCERSRLTRTQIAQLADGLSPAQQASAFWRDRLPWPARLIPSSQD